MLHPNTINQLNLHLLLVSYDVVISDNLGNKIRAHIYCGDCERKPCKVFLPRQAKDCTYNLKHTKNTGTSIFIKMILVMLLILVMNITNI